MKWMASKTTPDMSFPIDAFVMDDITSIQKAFLARGILISERSVEQAWAEYSDEHFAGWIGFSDANWAADEIIPFLKDVD